MTTPRPFELKIPDTAIQDLRERLARTRFPDQAPGAPWAYGTDLAWMRELVEYWQTKFNWRAQEARLNAFPQSASGQMRWNGDIVSSASSGTVCIQTVVGPGVRSSPGG